MVEIIMKRKVLMFSFQEDLEFEAFIKLVTLTKLRLSEVYCEEKAFELNKPSGDNPNKVVAIPMQVYPFFTKRLLKEMIYLKEQMGEDSSEARLFLMIVESQLSS